MTDATADLLFFHDRQPYAWLIQQATHGPYNHVAVVCGDGTMIEATISGVKRSPVRSGVSISVPVERAEEALSWLLTQTGHAYDPYDILLAGVFTVWPDAARAVPYIPDDHYICSELVAWYLRKAGYAFPKGQDTNQAFQLLSPNGLYRLIA